MVANQDFRFTISLSTRPLHLAFPSARGHPNSRFSTCWTIDFTSNTLDILRSVTNWVGRSVGVSVRACSTLPLQRRPQPALLSRPFGTRPLRRDMFRQAVNGRADGQRQQKTIDLARPTSQSTTGVPGPIITSKASSSSFPPRLREGQVVVGGLQATLLQPTPLSTLNRAPPPTINNIGPVRSGPLTPGDDLPRTGSQMQTAVFFQEDDFDDDIDLDLDVEDPATKGSVSQPSSVLPATSSIEVVATPADPPKDARLTSSAPLAWSSSPARPPTTSLPSVPTAKTTSSSSFVTAPAEPPSNDLEDANPRPRKKGRSLFWQQNDRDRTIGDDGMGRQDALRSDQTPIRTRLEAQQPWDQTASAVKENRRQLKEARKKSQSADPIAAVVADTTRSSSRKAIGRVFLSDEQRAIADMIIRQKKSVFFTGSAGWCCSDRDPAALP